MIMNNADSTVADLQDKLRALELDRDYWRDQHDLVLQDWRDDIEAWSAARAELAAGHAASHAALVGLLRFFDPSTGAVSARLGQDFLSDAFAKARLVCEGAAAATRSSGSPI